MTAQEMVSVNSVLAANSVELTSLVFVEVEALLRKAWTGNDPFDLKFDIMGDDGGKILLCYLYYNEKNEKYKVGMKLEGTTIHLYLSTLKDEPLAIVPDGFKLMSSEAHGCPSPKIDIYESSKTYSVINDDLSYLIADAVKLLQGSKK